ncbi:MAG: repeat-associated core domain protein, partial [Bacteroidetes bacterium]|nr:repeat-associated core domain protein [Bacteroidota bacterium]
MLKKFSKTVLMKKHFKLIFAALLLIGQTLKAGKEKMNARINASSFSVGNAVVVADNKFPNVTVGNTASVKSSIARITLGLDNTASVINHLPNSNTYLKVGVKITHTDVNGNYFTQVKELTINHNASGLTTDRSNVVIKNAHMIIARILYFKNSSNVIVPSPFIPSNIFMEAEVETERYYPLTITTLPTLNHYYHSVSNELEVYWNSVPGAEEYELEYTYVNDIASTSTSYDYANSTGATINTMAGSGIPFTFNNNATRIRTSKNNFKISLNYNSGMIVYRIRTVGRSMTNNDLEVFGDWTLNQPQTVASLTLPGGGFNDFYTIATGHEPNKNWQVTTTFAEEGKKKDVIGYFDGSNRKRQIVTRTNTENISLIGETMYDSHGRPAITVLPSPDANYSMQLKYFENFNQSATQPFVSGSPVPYSRLDFENTSSSTCPVPAGGMYTGVVSGGANGASVYYSANNTNKENQNGYIPDAQQYPFTHQVYTPDNTGQVRYQSGVGETHKIGNGHETKSLEGDPDQEDLDKLFGSEAGYAEKYKKNMTVDANGQISVSYLNTEGKVVATALAGNAPQNVTQLSSLNVYPKSAKYINYTDGNYNFVNLAANGALTFKKKIMPDISGTYNFFYDIAVPQYTDNCISSFCYDCAYNLEIKLMDECNAVIYTQTATVGQPIDYTCGSPLYFSSTGFSPAFNSYLTAGKEYFLTKVLTINTDAMNQYLGHYINTSNNSCIKDLNYFQTQALALVDTNDCHMTCATCTTAIQNYWSQHNDANKANPAHASYDPNYIYMSPAQKQAAIDNCMKPCKPMTLCQAEFETMLQDMRPMGQYAQYNVSGASYNASGYDVSILNELNMLRISTLYGSSQAVSAGTPFKTYAINVKASWRNPEYFNAGAHNFSSPDASVSQNHYFDVNGNVSKVRLIPLPTNASGYYPDVVVNTQQTSLSNPGVYTDSQGSWTFPENLSNLKDFVFAYSNNSQWAYSLVKNHPEFNYFLDCDRQSDPALYSPAYTSEQFDADLRTANNMAEAYGTSGTINSSQSKWSLVWDNTTADLLSSDPYFKTGAPGASLYNNMLSRLYTNYQGTGTSVKQICAQMYSTAQMYYAPSACTSAATFGGTSLVCNSITYPVTNASLDEMWKSYREMYLIEKQKLLMETAHIEASNSSSNGLRNNYYNGAIGDPNFTPWNSFIKYSFNPLFIPPASFGAPFGTWGAGIIQNIPSFWPDYHNSFQGTPSNSLYNPGLGKGYFDFGSPSSFYHKSRYGNKVRRVPDVQSLSNVLAGGATDPNDMMSNLNSQVEAQIFSQTGQCPIYKRLELFLNMTAKKGTLFTFNTSHPLVAEPAFTKQMYDAIAACGGLTPSTWIPLSFVVVPGTNAITIEFWSGSTHLTAADIVLTNVSATTISNWTYVKGFKDIQFNGTIGTSAAFNIKALYQTSSTSTYSVLPFKGTTCVQSNCPELAATVNEPTCKASQQALELQDFLSAVVSDKSQSVSLPINLGNTAASNSANFFTTLVRYPFSSAVVSSAPSHTVTIVNNSLSSVITMAGVDGASQTITVDFVFTATTTTGPQSLNTAFSLSNIQPNVTNSTLYDFTIKGHYSGNVTQTFYVKINYPVGLCSAGASTACRFYSLKNCEPFVSTSCANNNAYKTKIHLQEMLTDIFTFPNSTAVSTSNLTTYTSLLQNQFGPTINTFVTFVQSSPTATTGITNYTVDISMVSPVKDCRMTLYTTSNVPTNLFTTSGLVFSGIEAVPAPSNQFTASASNGLNTFTFTGIAPCLELDNCNPCKEDIIIHDQNFESYTNQTTTAALNFASERYEPTNYNPAVACTFQGATCAGNTSQPIANLGDLSIQSVSTCMGFPDHTSSGIKYLQAYIFHPLTTSTGVPPTTYIEPWKNSSALTTVAGKTYSVSLWFNYAQDDNMFRIQLLVNDGTNDIVLSQKDVNVNDATNYNPFVGVWQPLTALYNANSTTSLFKIRILPLTSASDGFSSMRTRVAIDDILIKQLGCEKETAVPSPPEPLENDCANQLINIAMANAQQQYNLYINNVKKEFKEAYTQKCYKTQERLNADYQSSEGHYTLYYYDQGGNLIKTVPPQGVEPINLSAIDPVSGLAYGIKIKSDRDNKQKTVFTNHRMATRYEYNSLNQLIRQHMPDHSDVELYSANTSNTPPAPILNMDFASSTVGYMIGNTGSGNTLYMTTNGGNTWVQPTGLTTGDIIDIDYAGSTAYAIVSDGSILKSTTYNTSTPVWQQVILPGSNTMQFTDIEFYSSTNGCIVGKNGLYLSTNDGGITWTSVNLGIGQDFNKIDFKNDGSGTYGMIAGNYGTILYSTPSNLASNLWSLFTNVSTGVDLLNVSILSTGNGSSSYINAFVSGIDNNITPGRGTVIQLVNVDGTAPAVNNLYINPSSAAISKVQALSSAAYMNGSTSVVDVFFGGSLYNFTPSPILHK